MFSSSVLRKLGMQVWELKSVCVVSCDQLKCLKWSSTLPTVRFGLLSISSMQEASNQLKFDNFVGCMVMIPLVMEWPGNGLGSSSKAASLCLTNSVPVGHFLSITIWCVVSMKQFVKSGGSQFHRFPWIFHNCHGVFSQADGLYNEGIGKLVPWLNNCLNNGRKYI